MRHTSAWFRQSANKEADKRGSRASISVDGLRLSESSPPTTNLSEMVEIARSYFVDLHTPESNPPSRLAPKKQLLGSITEEYGAKPPPLSISIGPSSSKEVHALKKKMPNTALGPDGIPYTFWKALASLVDKQKHLPSFWDTFRSLTDDIHNRGTNCCWFKDANISLFYKKGDPTLTKNYWPISSMNTDCKMWSNLINSRLTPWAVSKIHPDQKGFIPGRYITEHTRLAAEVAHLSNSTNKNGYIVSLDQAKAYDRTDIPWLLDVLSAMGVCTDLIELIKDHTFQC